MRLPLSLSLMASATLSAAAPAVSTATGASPPTAERKVLIGSPATISLFSYTADTFALLTNETLAGSVPSWMLLKPPSTLYAVDENSATIRHLRIDTTANTIVAVDQVAAHAGAVYLTLAPGGSRLLSSVYGSGVVDMFSIAANESLALSTSWVMGAKGSSHPHQTLIDPSGRFAVTNDLGLDEIIVTPVNATSSSSSVRVSTPPGCGPRHGAFLAGPGCASASTSYYAVVCEETNIVVLYRVAASAAGLALTQTQTISTFASNATNAAARAGELVASADGRHVYVSNRLTGAPTDSLTHLTFDAAAGVLAHSQTVSCGGRLPRMMSLAPQLKGQDVLFVANQQGEKGLVAFAIESDGAIGEEVASVPMSFWGSETEGVGPQFVQEVPL